MGTVWVMRCSGVKSLFYVTMYLTPLFFEHVWLGWKH